MKPVALPIPEARFVAGMVSGAGGWTLVDFPWLAASGLPNFLSSDRALALVRDGEVFADPVSVRPSDTARVLAIAVIRFAAAGAPDSAAASRAYRDALSAYLVGGITSDTLSPSNL